MKRGIRHTLACTAAALAISFGIAAPVFAANQGSYSGTLTSGRSMLATGDHSSSYDLATVSVDSGCSAGGVFWYEIVGGGRCTTAVYVSPRVTRNLAYSTNYSGGVQLFGTLSGEDSTHWVSGYWRANVR